jgi:hypothetical protein
MEQILKPLLAGLEQIMAEMKAEMKTNKEMLVKMIAKMDGWIEGMEACLGKLKANQEKLDAVAEHQKVPKEEATLED